MRDPTLPDGDASGPIVNPTALEPAPESPSAPSPASTGKPLPPQLVSASRPRPGQIEDPPPCPRARARAIPGQRVADALALPSLPPLVPVAHAVPRALCCLSLQPRGWRLSTVTTVTARRRPRHRPASPCQSPSHPLGPATCRQTSMPMSQPPSPCHCSNRSRLPRPTRRHPPTRRPSTGSVPMWSRRTRAAPRALTPPSSVVRTPGYPAPCVANPARRALRYDQLR